MRERRKAPSLGNLRHHVVNFLRRSRKECKQCQRSMCLTPLLACNLLRLLTGARKSPSLLHREASSNTPTSTCNLRADPGLLHQGHRQPIRWLVDTAPHTQGLWVDGIFTQSRKRPLPLGSLQSRDGMFSLANRSWDGFHRPAVSSAGYLFARHKTQGRLTAWPSCFPA